jgi:hypothetical protein
MIPGTMSRMNNNLRRAALAVPVLATIAAMATGCGTNQSPTFADGSASAPPSSAPSKAAPTPTPAPAPTFPDVTRGSTAVTANLLSYDAAAGSAVVVPTLMLTGEDYCKRFKVKASDSRCQREWITVDSHTKITLPVGPDAKLLSFKDGDPGCVGNMIAGGTCPVSKKEFAAWTKDNPEGLIRISTKDGTIVKMAQVFTP